MPTIREMAEITVTKQTGAKMHEGIAAVVEVFAEFGRVLVKTIRDVTAVFAELAHALQPKGAARMVVPQMSYPGVDMQFRHRGR